MGSILGLVLNGLDELDGLGLDSLGGLSGLIFRMLGKLIGLIGLDILGNLRWLR